MKFYNRIVDKGGLKKLIAWAYTNYGSARSAQIADQLKELGFKYATKAGVSISVDDLQVPPVKRNMIESAEQEIRETERRYAQGEITEVERFQKVIDTWNGTSEALKDEVVRNFKDTNPLNSVYMMAFSGARGNLSQVRQLVGMRGLMADPQGEIIDLPIKTNFREGLTVTEYIISSYGARKGLVDTALRTADSGYLTRRLVDVSQDVIVREIDCGTKRGIKLEPMKDGDRVLIPLQDRLLGRMLAEDVVDPHTQEVIAQRNQSIDGELAQKIGQTVDCVYLRSPLTCEAARSVCQYCYGWSLAHGKMVNLGEAIGIIAAQSIGEPGTQLTMRTFHTGGVFTGEVARQIKAEKAGTIKFGQTLQTRKVRTRHGDELAQVEAPGDLIFVASSGKKQVYPLVNGYMLFVDDGQEIEKGQLICEVASSKQQGSTEKAAKDVSSDLAGEVLFADLSVEEKTDRQGNSTRVANRAGMLWVLSGEVYNLPPGAEAVVKNGSEVSVDSILAETKLVTGSGGVVRLTEGREIEIITASVTLDQAKVRRSVGGGREQYTIETNSGESFLLKATPGTKVINGDVVAELICDRYQTNTGGIIKYAGIETQKIRSKNTKEVFYEVTKGGTLLWIPEENHEINKDISLLNVENGEYVEAGTEVVKDIFCSIAGYVEVVQKNDILRSIAIKPGELHEIDFADEEKFSEMSGKLLQPGTEFPWGTLEEIKYGEFIASSNGMFFLLRPTQEYSVADTAAVPSQGSINQSGGAQIQLRSVQRLAYKDGEHVSTVAGVSLLSTQLILEIASNSSSSNRSNIKKSNYDATLSADIELLPLNGFVSQPESTTDSEEESLHSLQLVILESLVLRRDSDGDPLGGNIQTRLLVEDGQEIPPGAVVARTEIKCKEAGLVRGIRSGASAVRRILIVRDTDKLVEKIDSTPLVQEGDLIVAGTQIAPGYYAKESGQVVQVKSGKDSEQVTLRLARPYRVSAGAILHIDNEDLVQRGDNLVLLVFERAKTGDIIQGLPRIEELLEARKPKEACLLNRRPGVCQIEQLADESKLVKVISRDGTISEYPLNMGQNTMVVDGQQVDVGEQLTDGPSNPHEILEVFFNYYLDDLGVYEATLAAMKEAQKFLVDQVQSVYQSQGIDISDKHIETIVRQMTCKVRMDDGGDTTMLPGELVELRQIEQVNEAMAITGGATARYTPILLGITKASLNTDSFISAASFQETTRVLTEAAIEGKSDWLRGLKENVIIGRLIPAGTGYNAHADGEGNDDMGDMGYIVANNGQIYSQDGSTEGSLLDSQSDAPNVDDLNGDVAYPSFGSMSMEEESKYGSSSTLAGTDVVLDDLSARTYTVEDSLEDTYGYSYSSIPNGGHPDEEVLGLNEDDDNVDEED